MKFDQYIHQHNILASSRALVGSDFTAEETTEKRQHYTTEKTYFESYFPQFFIIQDSLVVPPEHWASFPGDPRYDLAARGHVLLRQGQKLPDDGGHRL